MIIKTKYTKSSKYVRTLNNTAYHSNIHTFTDFITNNTTHHTNA